MVLYRPSATHFPSFPVTDLTTRVRPAAAVLVRTDANTVVKLELLDPKTLVGTLTLAESRKGGADRSLKLEKKE